MLYNAKVVTSNLASYTKKENELGSSGIPAFIHWFQTVYSNDPEFKRAQWCFSTF